jgi:Protein of unknown function (DUF2782)
MYRILLILAWSCVAASESFAAQDPPKNLEPLPDLSGPSAEQPDSSLEPQVTITRRSGATFEGYGRRGLKVTPISGKPYYLEDDRANGRLNQGDPVNQGPVVPRWKIFYFGD